MNPIAALILASAIVLSGGAAKAEEWVISQKKKRFTPKVLKIWANSIPI